MKDILDVIVSIGLMISISFILVVGLTSRIRKIKKTREVSKSFEKINVCDKVFWSDDW